MALQLSNMLAPVQALSPIPSMGVDPQASLERQRLELMQQEFENTKQQQSRQAAFQQLEEQGRNARAQLEDQRMRETAAAAQKEKEDTAKRALYTKFSELNGQGKIEEARAMVPEMNSLGMSVDLLGEAGGMPSYRVHMSPEEAKAAEQQGIGYPTNESTPMQAQPGIPSTEDAFKQAQSATQHFEETGEPAKGPDEHDYTGSVPKDVIDTGAIAASTRPRALAALGGFVGSMPQAYQEGASSAAQGAMATGLPLEKQIELYKSQYEGPRAAKQAELSQQSEDERAAANREAENARAGLSAKNASATGSREEFKTGFDLGNKAGETYQIQGSLGNRKVYEQIIGAMSNKNPADDALAGSLISRLVGEKGALSEKDVERALGTSMMSIRDAISTRGHQAWYGGLSDQQKAALRGVVERAQAADSEKLQGFLDNLQGQLESDQVSPDVKRGLKSYRDTVVPKSDRDFYDQARQKSMPPATSTFNMQKDLETNGPPGAIQIPATSRIALTNNNPGNLKFVGQPGAVKGDPAQDGGNWAKFNSPEEGLQALAAQIKHDAGKGLTVQEFVTKYAPPSSNDTKTYLQQFMQDTGAKPLDSLASIDPGKVLRFMARKESGTVVPEGASFEAKATASSQLTALLEKGGY